MKFTGSLTTISIVALALTASGCAPLRDHVANQVGARVGTKAADLVPTTVTTMPVEKGGNFCDTATAIMQGLGIKPPLPLKGLPRNAASEFALAVNDAGVKAGCWK